MIIIIIGVTGTGKSTIGELLAARLSLPFIEGDHFHPQQNVLKMKNGIPLNDEDRYPWLQSLSRELQMLHQQGKGAVLACSALKEKYRKMMQQGLPEKIIWICLEGPEDLIRQRMQQRKGHFMPVDLLSSQLAIFEKPAYAYCFSIDKDPETIVPEIMGVISALH